MEKASAKEAVNAPSYMTKHRPQREKTRVPGYAMTTKMAGAHDDDASSAMSCYLRRTADTTNTGVATMTGACILNGDRP